MRDPIKPNANQRAVVARGAAFLDTHLPGWEQYVDWQSLNLSSPMSCVLAQLALKDRRLNYPRVKYPRNLPFQHAMSQLPYTFYDLGGLGFSTEYGSNAVLKRAWRDEIEKRLNIRVVSEKEAKKIKRDLRIVEPDEAYLASVLGKAAYELVA